MHLRDRFQRRPNLTIGIALTLLGALIYLPYLGAYPLWDPWEPHYSQVALEMQDHGTWLDPIYRGANNWWSKPILMLWLLRGSFALFWDKGHQFAHHELYARLPFALLAIAGGVSHFDWVRRLYGRYIAALSALVLITCAQYLLIGRQVMADLIMVFAYSNALGYLAVGLFAEGAAGSPQTASKLRSFLQRDWPFVAFWSLQGLAILAKGFLPPLLTLLAFGSFALLTRPIDGKTHQSVAYWLKRSALAVLLLALGTGALILAFKEFELLKEQQQLATWLVAVAAALLVGLVVFHDSAPSRYAREVLVRIRAIWGLPLCLAVAAPWYIFMTVRHGWNYWHTFIFFHHLGRAAGEIYLPGGSYDFYLRHWGFALFPWTGFFVAGLMLFVTRCQPRRGQAERRNLFLLCLIAAPLAFFMLTGTKFAHYIFPIVPACAVIVAASLVWLMRRSDNNSALAASNEAPDADYHRDTLAVASLISVLVFIVLMNDVRHDVRHLLRLFVYYFNRSTPFEYQPAWALTFLGLPILATSISLVFSRWVARWHLAVLGTTAVALACYLSWVTMPAMGATYSYRPVYEAYRACAHANDPIGQYNNWPQPERSVMFLFRNRAQHLNSDAAAMVFLSQKGQKFVIVDKPRLADLRRVAHRLKVPLNVVFDDHPYVRLLSTEPGCRAPTGMPAHVLGEVPSALSPVDANFDGKIRLHGWLAAPKTLEPGETVQLKLYFEALAPIERNWEVLIHGDNAAIPGHRIVADHFPAGGVLTTRGWQEGRIIEDEFTLAVPTDYPFESFFVWIGFQLDGNRIPLANNPASDGADRVRGPLIFVTQPTH